MDQVLDDINYRPPKADPNVWIIPAVKGGGFKYYEYVILYVDNILCIPHVPLKIFVGIKAVFKLKGDKAEPHEMYLGAALKKVTNYDGAECWTMSSEKYLYASIKNVEENLETHDLKFPTRCDTPISSNYHPFEDTTPELDASGVKYFHDLK